MHGDPRPQHSSSNRTRTSSRPAAVCALLFGLWLTAGAPAVAGAKPEEAAVESQAANHSASHHEEHGFHRHHLALILGGSQKGGKEGATYGLEYEYRLSRRFGLGVFWEQTEGDIEAETLGIPLSIHATRNFKVLVAAGVERQLFKDDETVLRLGLDYSFHAGRFTVAPSAAVDFVNDNEILFLGLALGRGF